MSLKVYICKCLVNVDMLVQRFNVFFNNLYYILFLVFQYEKVVCLYCEDQKQQPDEFFGVFDIFLSSFREAQIDLGKMKKQKEDEEKRVNHEAKVSFNEHKSSATEYTRVLKKYFFNIHVY